MIHCMSDWVAWRIVGFSKQLKDNGTFRSLDHDWVAPSLCKSSNQRFKQAKNQQSQNHAKA